MLVLSTFSLGSFAKRRESLHRVLAHFGVTEDGALRQTLEWHAEHGGEELGAPALRVKRGSVKRIVVEIEKQDGAIVRKECRSTKEAIMFLLRS